jgi:coenzyme F420-reducing hydrogenase alpha subunit
MSADRDGGARTRTLKVEALARVEGEGAMSVRIRGDTVEQVALRIYEPPRFFEGFLRGRAYTEPPDITARICGICPVAYQMSSVGAIEDACRVEVPEPIRLLRRLLYCGEWIESHGLHVFMLHAPDFLGYDGAIEMASDHPAIVEDALQLKKAGNTLIEVVGGRAIHPINVKVGGFYRAPTRRELEPAARALETAREIALRMVAFTGELDFPDFERDYLMLALDAPGGDYPIERGRFAASNGLNIALSEYSEHFAEHQVPHSTALHSLLDGERYLTGPIARFNLAFDRLSPLARDAALAAGVGPSCANPFKSIVVRTVEILYACDEALRLIEAYEPPDPPAVAVEPRAGVGHGATEAPRGVLYQRYEIDDEGTILSSAIVPPTSQNQATIERDMELVVGAHLDLDDAALTHRCEQAIRNYDPCISCSTHFLRLDVERS